MGASDEQARSQLLDLERSVRAQAEDLALLLVYDRPSRAKERAGLERKYFADRCVSDAQLARFTAAFRSVGAYVELFEGEQPLLLALTDGHVDAIGRPIKVIYNGLESCVDSEGFEPGRKALLPAVADSYGLVCANSNAYGCALGRHKFHYFTILRALGLRTPPVWHFRPASGWAGGRAPSRGTKVIVKSTYESWSVGVTEASIFVVDESCVQRVGQIATEIGQAVTVQEFIPGVEVNVPVVACPNPLATPPVESVLAKAPGNRDAVVTLSDNLRAARLTYQRFEAPPAVIRQLRATASAAFDALELRSFGRIDFRVDEKGRAWITDVGVEPGLAVDSSAARSLAELGIDHDSFLRTVIGASLARST